MFRLYIGLRHQNKMMVKTLHKNVWKVKYYIDATKSYIRYVVYKRGKKIFSKEVEWSDAIQRARTLTRYKWREREY